MEETLDKIGILNNLLIRIGIRIGRLGLFSISLFVRYVLYVLFLVPPLSFLLVAIGLDQAERRHRLWTLVFTL